MSTRQKIEVGKISMLMMLVKKFQFEISKFAMRGAQVITQAPEFEVKKIMIFLILGCGFWVEFRTVGVPTMNHLFMMHFNFLNIFLGN
jgi:uncharacterized RDD family membrane protein YckC